MLRTLFISTAVLLCAAASAHAGDFKVTSKALKPTEVQHLAGRIANVENGIMRWKDPHFDPQHYGSTPVFEVVPMAGAQLRQVRQVNYDDQYNAKASPAYKVTSLGPDNILHLTALLPVSGHVGQGPARTPGQKIGTWDILSNKNETAAVFAANNRYNITVTHVETGAVQRLSNIPSTGLVTPHELGIEMAQKGTYRIQFWADGSAGIGGYAAGRTIDIIRE